MDHLNRLQNQFEEIKKNLCFPLTIEDRQNLIQRRAAILSEAKGVAESLKLSGEHWFNAEA